MFKPIVNYSGPTRVGATLALALIVTTINVSLLQDACADTSPRVKKNAETPASELRDLDGVERELNKNWRFILPLDAHAGLGYLSGDGIVTESGLYFAFHTKIVPTFLFKKKKVSVGTKLSFDDRETIQFSLAKRQFQGGLFLTMQPNKKVEFGIDANSGVLFKPKWPDLYQPQLDAAGQSTGEVLPTDRNSYLHAEVSGYGQYDLTKHFSAKMYGELYYQNNSEDPSYDEVDSPTHLVPGDRNRIRIGGKLSGSTHKRFWRYSVDFRTDVIRYQKSYARDAQTGLTHAAPGGVASNPLQRFVQLRVRQRNSFRIVPNKLKAVLIGQFTRNIDKFDDYYTWNQFELSPKLILTPTARWLFEIGYAIQYKRYTSSGYQETDNHPPLDNGDAIRTNLQHSLKGRLELAVFVQNVRLFAQGEFTHNTTNFPDYEPGIHPSPTSQYKIDWDYRNIDVLAGILMEI